MKSSKAQRNNAARHIAVIEEVADNIYSIKFILESLGYRVRSFASGELSLEELLEFEPHLIIVDMMIPRRGGYTVMEKIGASPLSTVPILAITAAAMDGGEEEVYRAGGSDVLAKPYTVTDLQQKLTAWLWK